MSGFRSGAVSASLAGTRTSPSVFIDLLSAGSKDWPPFFGMPAAAFEFREVGQPRRLNVPGWRIVHAHVAQWWRFADRRQGKINGREIPPRRMEPGSAAEAIASGTGRWPSSPASCRPQSSHAAPPRPTPCRACRCATSGRRPTPARHRCDARSRQARAVAGGRVLQHLVIAVRVAEREDRPASDETVDADRDLPERPTGKPIARRGN